MKLTLDQIQAVTRGAVRVTEEGGRFRFFRLTEEQIGLYHTLSPDFWYPRALASAGIRMEFLTDSPYLSLTIETWAGSAVPAVMMEIMVNDASVGTLGSDHTAEGVFSGTYALGEGEKRIRIYFPWSARTELIAAELADGSSLTPVQRSKTMLIFGDSITQGAMAEHPSVTYASRLADLLEADTINKGVAGDVLHAELAEMSDEGAFDYIAVAYGTNDWKKTTREVFEQSCSAFYSTISRRYPNARIFAITPIWRANPERITDVGEFFYVRDFIQKIAADLPNVTVIDGYDFVPHDPAYFGDLRVHPNDKGFARYAENLYEEIKKYL